MIGKPNSITVFIDYSFKIIPSLKQAKTCLSPSMLKQSSIACLSASLGDKRLFITAGKYSPNSKCRPSNCRLAVLAMFLVNR